MLSKIATQIAHHSHHIRTSRNTRLTQLNNDCSAALRKVKIDKSLERTMNNLDREYTLSLCLEADAEYQNIPGSEVYKPDDSPEAEARAYALQLGRGLDRTLHFLENYTVTVPGMTLDAAINPKHREYLVRTLHQTFQALPESDQIALVSVVKPEVWHKFGIGISAEMQKLPIAQQKAGKPQLDENNVLALADYCSSVTGMFNAVNDGKRVWQLCGIDNLALITACLSQPLDEALNILSRYEAFTYSGPAYKGIALGNPAGQFRLSKMQPGMQYKGAHWSSATWNEKMNYANASLEEERRSKLVVAHAEGVKVHMFHDPSTTDQGEVMLRPDPLYFLSASEVNPGITKYGCDGVLIFSTMKPPGAPSGGNTKTNPALT